MSLRDYLLKEGIDPDSEKAQFLNSIYGQESGGGRNTKTSNQGAVGDMQIIPSTFNFVADKGWSIKNPEHNARAGIRYGSRLFDDYGAERAAVGYYSGEGGVDAYDRGVYYRDKKNPKAPNTKQYAQQVLARMNSGGSGESSGAGGMGRPMTEDEWNAATGFDQPSTSQADFKPLSEDEWNNMSAGTDSTQDSPNSTPESSVGILTEEEFNALAGENSSDLVNSTVVSNNTQPTAAPAPNSSGLPKGYTEGNTFAGDLSNNAGLAVRGVAEGVAGVPAAIYNTVGLLRPRNQIETPLSLPTEINPENDVLVKGAGKLSDILGLPKTEGEKSLPEKVGKGIGGFVAPSMILSKIAPAGSAAAKVAEFLGGKNPVPQVIGTVSGTAAEDAAKQAGGNELQQLLANIAGNVATGGVANMAMSAGRVGKRGVEALLDNNEAVVGRTLNRAAGSDNLDIISALETGKVPTVARTIKGYNPTTTDIAADPNMANILRQAEMDAFTASDLLAGRMQNQEAISQYANKAGATPEAIKKASAELYKKVDAIAKPMRTRNLPVDMEPVHKAIDEAILANRGNKYILSELNSAKANMPTGTVDFTEAYNAKQGLDELLRSTNWSDPKVASAKKAASALNKTKQSLSDTLTATEPGFKDYITKQAKVLDAIKKQEFVNKKLIPMENQPQAFNVNGIQKEVAPLSASKVRRFINNPEMRKQLSSNQINVLEDASNALNASGRRNAGMMTGSNTAQNLKINQMVSEDLARAISEGNGATARAIRGIFKKTGEVIKKPASVLGLGSNYNTSQLAAVLAKAELDPKYAAKLMKQYGLGQMNFNDPAGRAALRGLMTTNEKPLNK